MLQRVDVNGGRVRIGGEEWSARAFIEDQVIEPGTRVEMIKIEGATALVWSRREHDHADRSARGCGFVLLCSPVRRIVPQARAGVVERLGRYSRTLTPASRS